MYLFTTAVHTSILGALLHVFTYPLVSRVCQNAPAWGLTTLQDQQLSGLIMRVPAGISYLVAGLVLMAGWIRESEYRVLAREGSRA